MANLLTQPIDITIIVTTKGRCYDCRVTVRHMDTINITYSIWAIYEVIFERKTKLTDDGIFYRAQNLIRTKLETADGRLQLREEVNKSIGL